MVTNREFATELTGDEFNDFLMNNNGLIVAEFFNEWDMNCIMLAPVLENLAGTIKKARFIKINIDENEKLSQIYQIFKVPCIIIFKNGKEVERIIGNEPQEIIETIIQKYL